MHEAIKEDELKRPNEVTRYPTLNHIKPLFNRTKTENGIILIEDLKGKPKNKDIFI